MKTKREKSVIAKDGYKRLRNALALSKRPSKVISIVSAQPHEGRSMVAFNLAKSFAQKGEQVLLIDADLNTKGLSKFLGKQNIVGLEEIVNQYDPMQPVFSADKLQTIGEKDNPVYFIGAGNKPGKEVVSSKAFARLIKEAAREVDRIILDTPAYDQSADALSLAALADESVFVYDAASTSRFHAKEAMEAMEGSGTVINGIVMTKSPSAK